MVERKIAKVWEQGASRSKCIILPKEFCEKLGIKGGSYVEITMEGDKIVIRPI
ncbi:AbrB/MazE/SpoVT family DNA-binding domain-containing protein [Methanothermococcus sp. SCGC AD-155-E23]|uniref:AbrB/MazE/SpoVT family DNA-binding domain-containing protein n=1 Tax=Methanothermococcus okinawensis TaxID=155863 RepID=A0A833EEE7_9EURY|nr:AbrB/MazE/SpoVT family DNA-binding domain-containing protein [Methanothermococcus sp. SCGC AD-155-E23]HIQ33038.1 AbrB/MazE/SpoVT family DNA-binding domain-containing protein [Methanothermococcus okinawensis]